MTEDDMFKLMGFSGFDTTKVSKHTIFDSFLFLEIIPGGLLAFYLLRLISLKLCASFLG
jgi:hypothetical protein